MSRDLETSAFLFDMRESMRREARLPDSLIPRNLPEAYQAQDRLIEKLLARHGGHAIGYKIAATNVAAQRDMDVDAPFFGRLLSATTYPDPQRLSASRYTLRLIEAEFGFEIGADVPLSALPYTSETVRPYIARAFPSVELVNHRFFDWKLVGAPTLIADNAIHGGWIEGAPAADWQTIDFTRHPVRVIVNGELKYEGSSANVLGNPLNVVAWLANELPKFGKQLRRGDKITTGTTTEVYPAQAGDQVTADFGKLGMVQVRFDDQK